MKILVLHGMGNIGKSTTLNLLYGMLVPAFATSHGNRVVLGNPIQNDFSETITYYNQTVEFFTMGDYPKQLEIAIRNSASRNCDVLICACSRHSPGLLSALQRHATQYVSKSFTADTSLYVVLNTNDAQTILNLI